MLKPGEERFLGPDDPGLAEMAAFSVKLRALGINQQLGFGPTKDQFAILSERDGLGQDCCLKETSDRIAQTKSGLKPACTK